MLQRNPHTHTRHVPEALVEDRVYPACEVGPGATVDWPLPLAGFEPAGPAEASVDIPPPARSRKPRGADTSEEPAS